MTRTGLALCHLRRRPGHVLLLLLGLAAAVAAVVGLLAITRTMETELGEELRAGARRVVITPPRQEWDFTYGGFAVGQGLSYGVADLPADTVRRVQEAGGIDLVAPKLLELVSGPEGDTLVVGPAPLRAGPKLPPALASPQIPVSGERAHTTDRAVPGRPLPVRGPVKNTRGEAGSRGS